MTDDRMEQEKDARHSLRILREQHEEIKRLERDNLCLQCDVATLRYKLDMYKDRIIEMSLTPGQLLVRKLLEGRNHEKTDTGSAVNP